jgi:fructose-specific phosphotransferase system IIA component
MDLKDLIEIDNIISSLKSTTKKQAIHDLLQVLENSGKVHNKDLALKDILARESYLSTGMENGLAVPHAKTDAVNGLVVSFGLHRLGLEFESLDGKKAHFIFLVLSPRDTSGPHIQALASISRLLKEEKTREKLLGADTTEKILQIFSNS